MYYKTRDELKQIAKKWGWELLSEGNGEICWIMKSGATIFAHYNEDTDHIMQVEDSTNSKVQIDKSFKADDDAEDE